MSIWWQIWRIPLVEPCVRWVMGLALVCHVAWALGLGLSPDEAHYALYGRHLALSYYDHPPLVGWLQAAILVFNESDFALRLWPLFLWWLSGALLLHFNNVVFPSVREQRWWGLRVDVWLWLGCALPHLLGLALVPDGVLMPLTLVLMLMVWRLAGHCECGTPPPLSLWLGLGLALGFAGLAKYTAVLLALSVVLCLHWAYGFSLWRQKGWWLSLLVAAFCVSVVFIWNALNDWASFRYQLAHAQGGSTWSWWVALRYGLVVWLGLGLIWPFALVWPRRRVQSVALRPALGAGRLSPARLCWGFALPLLGVLLLASGRGSALPHWVTPAGMALLPWVSAALAQLGPRLPALMGWGLVIQVLGVLALALTMWAGGGPAQSAESTARPAGVRVGMAAMNPMADLHGWAQAAQKAQSLAQQHQLSGLAVNNWSLASRVAWYARPLSVRVVIDHGDQFNIWFGRFQKGDSVLWIDWSQLTHMPPQGPDAFASCTLLDRLDIVRWGRTLSHFHYYRCEHWQGK